MGCTVKKGLLRLNLPYSEKKFLSELSRQTKDKPEYRPSKPDILSLWLERYFKGKIQEYSDPIHLQAQTSREKDKSTQLFLEPLKSR